MAVSTAPAPVSGSWGGRGAQLTVTSEGAVLEVSCGRYNFGQFRLDDRQHVVGSGQYEAYAFGPQAGDVVPKTQTASFVGELSGDVLVAHLTLGDNSSVETYTLNQGLTAKIIRCL